MSVASLGMKISSEVYLNFSSDVYYGVMVQQWEE